MSIRAFVTLAVPTARAFAHGGGKTVTRALSTALPEGYEVPAVWTFEGNAEATAGSNRPTAGPRYEKTLPVGEHAMQLYSLGTPNGMKVAIMLEELNERFGTEYDAWKINIMGGDQFGSGFVEVNPNSKIPALVDRDTGARVFESASILKYLAEKHDALVPKDLVAKTECFNWLMWQMGSAPSLGAFGHFYKFAPVKIEYAIDRFALEAKRQLSVLETHLADKQYMCGDEITIADIAIYPWIITLDLFYNAREFLQLDDYPNVNAWVERIGARPAVQRGRRVNSFGDDALEERHSKADFEQQQT